MAEQEVTNIDVGCIRRTEPRLEYIADTLRHIMDLVDLESGGKPVKVDAIRLKGLDDWATQPGPSWFGIGSPSTACNLRCEFCYEYGNPPELERRRPLLTMAEALARIGVMKRHEGLAPFAIDAGYLEPFVHPRLLDMMAEFRAAFPEVMIELVTNGTLLTPDKIARLGRLAPVLVTLSVDAVREETRLRLLRDTTHFSARVRLVMESLRDAGVPFIGSVVAWPSLPDEELLECGRLMAGCGAMLVKICLPGYTKYYDPSLWFDTDEVWGHVVELVAELKKTLDTPVYTSPIYPRTGLAAVLQGAVANSPAAKAGLGDGDEIVEVDGVPVVSGEKARELLKASRRTGQTTLLVRPAGATSAATVTLKEPERGEYPYLVGCGWDNLRDFLPFGLAIPQGLRLSHLYEVLRLAERRGAKSLLVFVGSLLREDVEQALSLVPCPPGVTVRLLEVPCRYFGGNIRMADLATVDDYLEALRSVSERPDLVILASSGFSAWGRDLVGKPYVTIEQATGIPVEIIDVKQIDF